MAHICRWLCSSADLQPRRDSSSRQSLWHSETHGSICRPDTTKDHLQHRPSARKEHRYKAHVQCTRSVARTHLGNTQLTGVDVRQRRKQSQKVVLMFKTLLTQHKRSALTQKHTMCSCRGCSLRIMDAAPVTWVVRTVLWQLRESAHGQLASLQTTLHC